MPGAFYISITSKLKFINPGSGKIGPSLRIVQYARLSAVTRVALNAAQHNPGRTKAPSMSVKPCCFNLSLTRAASDPASLCTASSLPRLSCCHLTEIFWLIFWPRFSVSVEPAVSFPCWILVELRCASPTAGKRPLDRRFRLYTTP